MPEQLDAEVAWSLGVAFAEVVARGDGARQVVVGHDMRDTSPASLEPSLRESAAAASTSC